MIKIEETIDGKWAILEKHESGLIANIIIMTVDEILELFNKTVPRTIKETYLIGDPNCKHAWRPWKFNDDFMQCAKCPAMQKITRLVPQVYNYG
jgi:hypothetical protein